MQRPLWRYIGITLITLSLLLTACSPAAVSQPGPAASASPAPTPTPAAASSATAPTTDNGQSPSAPTPSGLLKVVFIDVGQADSILILQGNHAMLVDAGNNADASTVLSRLHTEGVTHLEMAVGTHPHEDHIGSLDAVLASLPVDAVMMPKVTSTTKTFADVVAAIRAKNLSITTPVPGKTFLLGTAKVTVLAPNAASYENLNDYSVVLRVDFGSTSFLLAGDAANVSEGQMLQSGWPLSATVLKVGHHGSATSTSSAFLDRVKPQYAVISVGAGNSYGHPTQATMEKLESRHITVYRTDENGTVAAVSDGKTVTFSTPPGDYRYGSTSAERSGTPTVTTSPTTTTGPPATQAVSKAAAITDPNAIVYITKTGAKYHEDGCRYLSKSKIPITLREAQARGYTPCLACPL